MSGLHSKESIPKPRPWERTNSDGTEEVDDKKRVLWDIRARSYFQSQGNGESSSGEAAFEAVKKGVVDQHEALEAIQEGTDHYTKAYRFRKKKK